MSEKEHKDKNDDKQTNPPTPSQAEGDERTVDQALKNKQSKDHK